MADDELLQIVQFVKEAGFLKERRMSVKQFDNYEELRKGGPAEGGDTGSIARGVAIKELSKLVFENIEALCNVSYGAVALRGRSALQSSCRVVKAFIDDTDPQEEVSQRNRVGTYFPILRLFLGCGNRRRRVAARLFRRLPHGAKVYGEKMSRALTNPWNGTLRLGFNRDSKYESRNTGSPRLLPARSTHRSAAVSE
jgi:hypothetical protein